MFLFLCACEMGSNLCQKTKVCKTYHHHCKQIFILTISRSISKSEEEISKQFQTNQHKTYIHVLQTVVCIRELLQLNTPWSKEIWCQCLHKDICQVLSPRNVKHWLFPCSSFLIMLVRPLHRQYVSLRMWLSQSAWAAIPKYHSLDD